MKEFEIIPIISPIEDLCIKIRKDYRVKLPDAIILSTAKYTSSILGTGDKDLQKIMREKFILLIDNYILCGKII